MTPDLRARLDALKARGVYHFGGKHVPMITQGEFFDLISAVEAALAEARDGALEDAAEISDGLGEPSVAMEIRGLKGQKP